MSEIKPMNPEIKEKWIERLESGEVEQVREVLGDEHGARCCLGVLCDVAIDMGLDSIKWQDGVLFVRRDNCDDYVHTFIERSSECWHEYGDGDLPDVVVRWAGLSEADPLIDPEYAEGDGDGPRDGKAINANDDRELSFKEIAALIRQNL